MNYIPFERMQSRVETSKSDSDLGYFYDLLLYGEFLTKTIALYLVSTINEDGDRTQYRLEHSLVRANAIGDFSKVIEEIVIGPAAQQISSAIREHELKELTQRATSNDWQYEAQLLLIECLDIFGIEQEKLPTKSPLRNWFHLFTYLRNKTKGHGAPKVENCAKACSKLEKSIELITSNFAAFKRSWAHLHRNLNGKFRVSKITNDVSDFDYLKRETTHNYSNGIYIFLDHPRKVNLYYTNAELTDFWISNGNLKKEKFETISYLSDERMVQSASDYLQPVTKLPSSHTEGNTQLETLNNCLTNLPKSPDFYVQRLELERELNDVLFQKDRYPIVTLLGKGGVGKTSLALDLITKLTSSKRFDLIIWFSARDIDLLIDGPKQVQTKILNIEDISKDYCNLVDAKLNSKDSVQYFSDEMTSNEFGTALYVFDNFETVTNPIEVFEWINTYIRNPNKVLITSRISRNFKADYPIEIQGMTEDECKELVQTSAKSLKIEHLLSQSYIDDLILESDGHPYIIKILLGEVAKTGKANKIKRIVADQEKILTALFKRTFNTLSPASKRVFLTLCSWNSMVPMIAVEAVLWRPENEKMDVQAAIEELRQSSFIDVLNKNGNDIINVPLAATLFGKSELEVYPEKIKVLADRKLLMEFGSTTYSNLSSGLVRNIDRKFRAISKRINSVKEFENELPILEYIATKYPKTYEYIIQIFEEYGDYGKVKYFLREHLKHNITISEKENLWIKLADICKYTEDWNGESHALIELIQTPNVELRIISDAANRINNHIYNDYDARIDDYKGEMLAIIIKVFKSKTDECGATDLSRLGWLLLNNSDSEEAEKVVAKGLSIDPDNNYCQRLMERLNNTIR
jgi:energy-coupling factor transporter ATP-binding protein EcfA2